MVTTRPVIREYFCSVCGRFVFKSTATNGETRAKCESCRDWFWFRLGVDGKPVKP